MTYKITHEATIEDICFWVRDKEEYKDANEFLKDILKIFKRNEVIINSLTEDNIEQRCKEIEEGNTEILSYEELKKDLEILDIPEHPKELNINDDIIKEYNDFFDNISIEDKIHFIVYMAAEHLGQTYFDEDIDIAVKRLRQIQDNPTSKDIEEILNVLDN